jgi:hypothetical protein
MPIAIAAQQGSHLLITDGERYAVIERREDHFYNCHDHQRQGIPATDLSVVPAILDKDDWTDAETARSTFDAVAARGSQLAQRML